MKVEASAGRNGNLGFGATRVTFRAENSGDRALLWLLVESWRVNDWRNMKRRWIRAWKELLQYEGQERAAKPSRKKASWRTPT